MLASETYACVNLPWLYKNIHRRIRKADIKAKFKYDEARKIQNRYLYFQGRKERQHLNKSATVIQAQWRGYATRKLFYDYVEDTLNKAIIDSHNHAATVIQSLWRGYISRLKIHDHLKMKSTQLAAAKELIICIAYKLHHLLRTRQTPGIYSIKNSHVLSRVEQLMASLKFKEFNQKMRRLRAEKEKKLAAAKDESMRSQIRTKVPYSPVCNKFFKENKVEKMLSMLDTVDPVRKTRSTPVKPPQMAGVQPKDVRDDVVRSMRRWKIVNDEKNLSVSPCIVSHPENIENFLCEMETICQQQKLITGWNGCCF